MKKWQHKEEESQKQEKIRFYFREFDQYKELANEAVVYVVILLVSYQCMSGL